ncbi:MAG: ABC transporter permease [Acidimicrobiia bacterium]|nr:ABC transporter permease [Acidimicrobiia bacterium]
MSLTFLIRRFGQMIVVMVLVATAVFVIFRLIPGNPAALIVGADATSGALEAMEAELGLDRPLHIQYVTWGWGVLRGDFGDAFGSGGIAVSSLLPGPLFRTLELATISMILALAIAVPLGVFAAVRAGTWLDQLVRLFAVTGFSLPSFVFALLLLNVFALRLGWFPVGGYVAASEDLAGHIRSITLPAITVGITLAGILVRFVYSSMLEVLRADYVRTARSKGLTEFVVTSRHALRNAGIPVVTIAGLQFGLLVGGMVIVEVVFSWPGLGQLMVQAIATRSFNVVQAAVLVTASVFVVVNTFVDILYTILDPRVSY